MIYKQNYIKKEIKYQFVQDKIITTLNSDNKNNAKLNYVVFIIDRMKEKIYEFYNQFIGYLGFNRKKLTHSKFYPTFIFFPIGIFYVPFYYNTSAILV